GVRFHIRLVRYHRCHVTHWRLCHTAMHAPNQCQVCPTARAALNLLHNAKSTMRSEDGICGQHDMPSAFDLLELDGRDLRRRPIEERKSLLAKLLHDPNLSLDAAIKKSGIVLNQHYEEDGAAVYRAACQLGCEGIVSKRLGSIYRRGRSPNWIKVKNPNAPAVKREAEEDWGR